MRIAIHKRRPWLAVLHGGSLKLHDISGAIPRAMASRLVENGRRVSACDAFVGVLTGELAVGRFSVFDVAPQERPVPALDVSAAVPHLTDSAELRASISQEDEHAW
jgi:hypothetical protein